MNSGCRHRENGLLREIPLSVDVFVKREITQEILLRSRTETAKFSKKCDASAAFLIFCCC